MEIRWAEKKDRKRTRWPINERPRVEWSDSAPRAYYIVVVVEGASGRFIYQNPGQFFGTFDGNWVSRTANLKPKKNLIRRRIRSLVVVVVFAVGRPNRVVPFCKCLPSRTSRSE